MVGWYDTAQHPSPSLAVWHDACASSSSKLHLWPTCPSQCMRMQNNNAIYLCVCRRVKRCMILHVCGTCRFSNEGVTCAHKSREPTRAYCVLHTKCNYTQGCRRTRACSQAHTFGGPHAGTRGRSSTSNSNARCRRSHVRTNPSTPPLAICRAIY